MSEDDKDFSGFWIIKHDIPIALKVSQIGGSREGSIEDPSTWPYENVQHNVFIH